MHRSDLTSAIRRVAIPLCVAMGVATFIAVLYGTLFFEQYSGESLTKASDELDWERDIHVAVRGEDFDPDSGIVHATVAISDPYPFLHRLQGHTPAKLVVRQGGAIIHSFPLEEDLLPKSDQLVFSVDGEPQTYPFDSYSGFLDFTVEDTEGTPLDLSVSVVFAGSFPRTIVAQSGGASVLWIELSRSLFDPLAFIAVVALVVVVVAAIGWHALTREPDITILIAVATLAIGFPAIRRVFVPGEIDALTAYDVTFLAAILAALLLGLGVQVRAFTRRR